MNAMIYIVIILKYLMIQNNVYNLVMKFLLINILKNNNV